MSSAQDRVPASRTGDKAAQNDETNCCATLLTLSRLQDAIPYPSFFKPSYPPVSSIPRTSIDRLSAPDASPSPFPSEPVSATEIPSTYTPPGKPPSVLYLAYGSNLCAQTFLGQRGIRPISQVNVSCPSLRLTFNLPGFPYVEPCFANTALRKVPKTPPKLPPDIPDLPDPSKPPPNLPDVPDPRKPSLPPPRHWLNTTTQQPHKPNEPVWDKGLIGVVYEVTKSDYAKIVATEGGGAGYHDIMVPCIPLPASVGVPERPPEIPIPFLAHTLFAPRLPDVPDEEDTDTHSFSTTDDDDDDKDPKPTPPTLPDLISRLPKWAQALFLPTSRSKSHPFEPYAQPSARYLDLITTGAAEHDLPQAYQEYLATLQPYTITTRGQQVARWLVLLFVLPVLWVGMLVAQRLLVDPETGRLPAWVGLVMNFWGNLVWGGYDVVGRGVFGEGERTVDKGEEEGNGGGKKKMRWVGADVEKQNLLMRDW